MSTKKGRNKIKTKTEIFNIVKIAIGTLIMAIGIDLFLLPNQLSTGGFSGIATIFYYLFKLPIGTTILVLNIPLFIISYFRLGKNFLTNALVGTFFLSYFLNIFEQINPITTDNFLAFLYGSVISGIGMAIVLKANASTGGTDLLASIIRTYNSKLKTGTLIVIFDAIIIAGNTIFFKDLEVGLYSALGIYVMGKILDLFFEGINFTKMLVIISPKWEKISERLEDEINRGVTSLYGQGMYKKQDSRVLLCVMSRNEVNDARQIIKEIDPNAFTVVTNAREVFGEGFKET